MNYKNYTPIPLRNDIYFHIQRFKFIDFMVIELRFFKKEKKKKMKNMDKMWKSFFRYYVHITSQHNQFLYTDYFIH